jgi:hypothetical protein
MHTFDEKLIAAQNSLGKIYIVWNEDEMNPKSVMKEVEHLKKIVDIMQHHIKPMIPKSKSPWSEVR